MDVLTRLGAMELIRRKVARSDADPAAFSISDTGGELGDTVGWGPLQDHKMLKVRPLSC